MNLVSEQALNTWGSFAALWSGTVKTHGASEFLRFEKNGEVSSWRYEEFDRLVDRTVSTLRAHGVGSGDSIHLCLKNCPGFIAVWLAAARMGAWFVPVDPQSSARDIANHVRRTGPVIGICATQRAQTYREGAQQAGLTVLEIAETAEDLLPESSPLVAEIATTAPDYPDPERRLAIMFTSGTTSEPKGVELTQANYACVGISMAEAAQLKPHHRWFVTLPLFHANAQYYCFASAIAVGASVALTAEFSASRWIAQSRELEATHASLFASPIRMILARTPKEQPPGNLQHIWYAQNLARGHHQEFAEITGCLPRQIYGMTETLAVVTQDTAEPPSSDVIGTVLPNRRAALLDPETHTPVPPHRPGLIAVAGDRGEDLFFGYLEDPLTTSRSFITDEDGDDWFLTGDLAIEDDSGAWSFVGRIDDVIKVSGENVSLTEVEAAVAEAPGVLEAAVVAVADDIRGSVPIAYVVPCEATVAPTVQELSDWADINLAPARRPREWHLTDELPRTSVGKIRRFKLAEQR